MVALTHAILLWTDPKSKQVAHATLNDVVAGEIQPSKKSMSIAQVHELSVSLRDMVKEQFGTSDFSIFPEHLLHFDPLRSLAMWWRSASPAPQFFDCEELGKIQGVVPMPSLIFRQCGTSLSVCAVRGRTRPREDTPIFHAPMFNTGSLGEICLGGVELEPVTEVRLIEANQDAFLRGVNTHPNGGHRKTNYQHGIFALWRDLIATPEMEWDDAWLVPMSHNMTLDQWLKEAQ